ncbi:Sulfotransferase domain-containing protein [Altererythrobacter xiamenensis]|uniref:Sulfotransferase domain-containing protein n=1 Tax=Altererythrobacter xiamenensis TaxID=1316679 RepID=A0A1Y6F884_9SPHN|nr:sulfotransferase domain-containing protein [Altererythrobacter xiamenensis]SMQ69811.1 Sulfotransferase domain-containing protein [Altererythrobacter xiamenensis]
MTDLIGQARSVEDFGAVMGKAMAGERPHHKPYECPPEGSPADVFITSWAKSGTTMMQQMFHQIRTAHRGGDMDFDDISRVVPWDDTAYMLDFDMTVPQRAQPRGFKSHREYERLPEGQRYVITLREPKETYVSMYRFFNGWQLERDAVSMEDFWPLWLGGGPGGCDYATHITSWYARRREPDTLLLDYTWVVKNKEETVRRLAAFMGVDLSPESEALVVERASREFMVEHQDRFDDAMMCAVLEKRCGISADSDSTKVQASGSASKILPASVAEKIDALWAERIAPVTGHHDYSTLAQSLN